MNRIQKLDHPLKKIISWNTDRRVFTTADEKFDNQINSTAYMFSSEKRGRDHQSVGHRLLGTYLSDKRNSSQLQCDCNYITLVNVIEKYSFHKCNHYW
jgi:hypothetical protein